MKKKQLLCALLLLAALKSTAQDGIGERIHLGLVTPLSTQGAQARNASPVFALHALQGVNRDNKGLAVAGLYTKLFGSNRGVMISGLVNEVQGSDKGLAVAGLVNIARNGRGLQLAGLYNHNSGNGFAQIAGIGNSNRYSELQLAGLINITRNGGSQIAGLINKAGTVKGIQLAGLVNIADSSAYPIGIVNIIRQGEKQLGIQVYDDASVSVVLRTGSNKTYGIVGIGLARENKRTIPQGEAGLGYHIPIARRVRVNAELVMLGRTDFTYFKHTESLRTLLGWKLTKALELTAGPALYANAYGDSKLFSGSYIWKSHRQGSSFVITPGAIAGLNVRL
ncbi:hypothetical protein [Niabella beijingensis]|uniref:hypothetical protein n=1 Tax=Niabella beijingensis TaxID=2872700 RepID=UPI001CBDCC78|nr:hypothetical protein [Niabella beijingensis]MBZ4190933.1 hypothetical protein [Niabella beijingensis]